MKIISDEIYKYLDVLATQFADVLELLFLFPLLLAGTIL
jgi:hypothetical protein